MKRLAAMAPRLVCGALTACTLALGGCAELLGVGDFGDAPTGTGVGGNGSQMPELLWAGQLQGPGDDEVWGHDVDPSGKIGVCGPFEGTMVYRLDDGTSSPITSAASHDIYVMKLEPDGTPAWTKHFSGSGDNDCAGLAFGDDAFVHIAGSLAGTVDFEGTLLDAQGARVAYLTVLEDSGAVWRASQLAPPGVQHTYAVDVDPAHKHWAAGAFSASASFDSTTLESAAAAGFVASEDYSGSRQLVGLGAEGADDDEAQWAFAVHAQSGSRILVGGSNTAILVAGGHQVGTSSAEGNGFIAVLDGTGAVTDLLSLESPGRSDVFAFASHADGDLIVAGRFTSSLAVAGAAAIDGYADENGFVLKLGPDGSPTWALDLGLGGAQEVRDVTVDPEGNIYAVANFAGTIEVGGAQLISTGGKDGLLLSLDAAGRHRFHLWLASPGEVFVKSVALHEATGRLSMAGYFQSTLTFLQDGHAVGPALTSTGDRDGFVVSLQLPAGG